jgi:hypothetical protein
MSAAAWENFHKATLVLTKSNSLKQRLTDAFSRHLQHMPSSEMPITLRADFEALCRQMTQISPLRGESAVVSTVRKMSPAEVDACALRIVTLLGALHRVNGSSHVPATGNRQADDQGNGLGSRRPKPPAEISARIPTLISLTRV